MLRCCFTVMLQKGFVDYETSPERYISMGSGDTGAFHLPRKVEVRAGNEVIPKLTTFKHNMLEYQFWPG